MRLLKTAGFLAACVVLAAVMFHWALAVPPYYDDNDGLVRFKHPPTWFGQSVAYAWAIDHPAVYRWVNYGALGLFRVEIGEVPTIDGDASYGWNASHGRLAPRGPVNFLRCVNVIWLIGALACIAALAKGLTGGWGWGLLAAAPLALSRKFGGGVGSFIFTDATLAFFLALMVLAWVRFHLSGEPLAWRRVIVMGVIGGLVISSKYNGGLALAAYAVYLVMMSRGRAALWRPTVFAVTAFAVFVAVNPIMWQGGPVWWGNVLYDMFMHRLHLIEYQSYYYGSKGFPGRLGDIFLIRFTEQASPLAKAVVSYPRIALSAALLCAVYPAIVYVIWRARRERWLAPVALWAGFLAVGTVFTIHETFPRYLMPIYMPLDVLVTLSAVSVYRSRGNGGSMTIRVTAPAEPGSSQDPAAAAVNTSTERPCAPGP